VSRWLAIDHGTRRIGLAVGNTADGIACPVAVIPAQPAEDMLVRLRQLIAEYQVVGIVVGWPLNMDDTEGPQGRLAREAACQLAEATGMDVRLWDERLSSFAADEALAGTMNSGKKKARQDAVAAAAILQDFLASGGPACAPRPMDIPPKSDQP
jgi:putative Holliday junction resolvase